jgi:hypothetical protein
MKTITILLFALLSHTAMARTTSYEGSYSLVAPTEEGAIAKAQNALPAIRNMSNKDVIRDGRSRNCRFRRNVINHKRTFYITGVKLTKLYKITDNQIIEPYYMASIYYMFRNCREDKN